ncbi:hypothetical protein WKW80_16950 [Variovorax humicola]|uniref:Uncharacterized protein n=1 Tax=Variovorax humicola TaxID=1769758 RepID=A0ABU8W121_9BURK
MKKPRAFLHGAFSLAALLSAQVFDHFRRLDAMNDEGNGCAKDEKQDEHAGTMKVRREFIFG